MGVKSDAAAIEAKIDELTAKLARDKTRDWWPKYAFHSAQVQNAAAILNSGALLSRARAVGEGQLVTDSASPGIISSLTTVEKELARLYFRPKAPTQFANEGSRPSGGYRYGGGMPVPVYLMFDSKHVVTRDGVRFSRGRLRDISDTGDDATFFESIPFDDVYHDGPMPESRKEAIKDARHAEILVPDSLDLTHLRFVVCRSDAEKQTLLSLLDPAALKAWRGQVALPGAQSMFFKRWNYVESVEFDSNHTRFHFHRAMSTLESRPFALQVTWIGEDGWRGHYSSDDFEISRSLRINLREPHTSYSVSMTLDDELVFQGAHSTTGPALF